MKVKLHPLVIVLGVYLILIGKGLVFAGYVLAMVLHEKAHCYVGKLRGYNFGEVKIMPYGGICHCSSFLNKKDIVLIMLAGPIANFIVALIIVSIWWIFPEVYIYSRDLCYSNIALGAINLLPCYPLDGSNVVCALFKNKVRVIKILQIVSYVVGCCLFVLMCISFFYKANITIGIFGLFLILSAYLNTDKEIMSHVAFNNISNKNFEYGIKKTVYYICKKTTLYSVLTKINPYEICEFRVLDSHGLELIVYNEKDVYEFMTQFNLFDNIGLIISLNKN